MATTARATRRIPGAPPTSATQFRAPGTTKTYELSTPCPSAPPPDLDGAKPHSQTGASWGTALWSTCQNHPGQRTTHSTMNHFAHNHAPTRTSNSPHHCHRTGISTACPVGWEWARVGMRVGAGVHVLGWEWAPLLALAWAWCVSACPLGVWGPPFPLPHRPRMHPRALHHAPPLRHRVAHGTRCVHHATGSRPHSIQTDKRATHQDMHAGTPTHANTQHTTQTHQHHHTTTHHHASTPTPTPPSPHHHHATTSTHTRHTWQRKTYTQ